MSVAHAGTYTDAFRRIEAVSPRLWVLAILFFGVGDLATTALGLSSGTLVEVGPLAAPILERFGLVALVALKAGSFAACYLFWRWTPAPSAAYVPLWLTGIGVVVTGWNVSLLLVAT